MIEMEMKMKIPFLFWGTLASNNIPYKARSGFIFSTNQSAMNLLNV